MASTNIDRTAVVKLALFGSVNLEEGMHDLSKQLHSFSYAVIDTGGGDQSYKFKIELVNTDESFIKSIIHAYSSVLSNKSGIITKADNLKSFPKLLIQWGYNNSLSKIHTAQLSNLTYRFTQGKEKILIIEAINAGDWAKDFYEKAAKTKMVLSMDATNTLHPGIGTTPESAIEGGGNLNGIQVLIKMVSSLLLTVNGTEVHSKFSDAEMEFEVNTILSHLITNERKAYNRDEKSKTTADLSIWPVPGLYTRMKFRAIRKFFGAFGISLINATDQENAKSERYLSVQETISKDDAGVHGFIPATANIPYSQLKDSTKVGDLNPALEDKAKSEMRVSLDINSNSDAANVISLYVADYNALVATTMDPTAMISESSVKLNTYVPAANQNSMKAGSQSIPHHIASVDAVNGNGVNVGSLGLLRNSRMVKISSTTSLAGESLSIKDKLKSIDYGVQQAKKEAAVDKVLTEEQKNKYNTEGATTKKYSELPFEQQQDLLYSNLILTLHSPEGTSTLETARDIIKKFNNIVSNATTRLNLTEESAVTEGESFEELYNRLTEIPEDIITTIFKIKSGVITSKDARSDLPEIESFPEINYETSSGMVSLSYGEADSIVKYFDFNGDMRVLANILGSVALIESLENEYEYLNTATLGLTVAPVLKMLLEDEEFIKSLDDDDKIDGPRLLKDLKALYEQLTPARMQISGGLSPDPEKSTPLSSEFFQDIGYITTHINSDNFIERLEDGGLASGEDATKYKNTLRFLRSIAQAEGTKALFSRNDITKNPSGNTTMRNFYEEAGGTFTEDLVEIPPTYVYTLVGNNIFDEYAASKAEQEGKKSLHANSHLISMDAFYAQSIENWEIKIKTLGIPEMDTLAEINAPRLFKFSVHDLSSEQSLNKQIGDPTNVHWLTGIYQPLAIKHTINSSGYETEFKLLKNLRLA